MRCPKCSSIVFDHRGRGDHPHIEFQGPPILICQNGHHMDRKNISCNEKVVPPRKPLKKPCKICKKPIIDRSPGYHRLYCARCKYQVFLVYSAGYRKRKRGERRGSH